MSETAIAAVVLSGALVILLASGVWVALALLCVGILGAAFFSPAPVGPLLSSSVWEVSWNWALTALPLFLWMGEILFRSRLSEDLFGGLAPWLRWLPGRLLHVNVLGCGLMAAVSGSSPVTCATVGRMSVPELKKLGYDERMSIGTLAGSATLGILIPPSIQLIVYGIVAEVSVARLFIAGILPGLLLVGLFMAYVAVWGSLNRDKAPPLEAPLSLVEKLRYSRRLIPVVLLIAAVLGSIYGGIATPTEAAVSGVIGALAISAATGSLTRTVLRDSLLGATRTTCMITFIVVSAQFLSMSLGFTGIPTELAAWVQSLGLTSYELLAVLTVFFIALGCLLDGVSMLVLTAAIVLPMLKTVGIDLLWFGIYFTIVVEIAMITPPIGLNLFVLQGITQRDIWLISKAAAPMFALMIVGLVLITVFSEIVLFLPQLMYAR